MLSRAAQLETRSQQAAAEAVEQQRQLGELPEAGSGPSTGRDLDRIRGDVRLAEDSSARDREQAHRVDLAELDGQREQLTRHGGSAETARHEALGTERRHRAEMPDTQAITEGPLRLDWLNEQRRVAQERAAQ